MVGDGRAVDRAVELILAAHDSFVVPNPARNLTNAGEEPPFIIRYKMGENLHKSNDIDLYLAYGVYRAARKAVRKITSLTSKYVVRKRTKFSQNCRQSAPTPSCLHIGVKLL